MDSTPQRRYKLLIVEDDFDVLPYLIDAFTELSDFIVYSAEDGVQALEQVYRVHPDCLLIDVKMPHLDGLQLVRALRGDPETEGLPVVMLTAMSQDKDHYLGMAAGADYYLLKPVEIPDIILAIHSALTISDEGRINRMRNLADLDPPLH